MPRMLAAFPDIRTESAGLEHIPARQAFYTLLRLTVTSVILKLRFGDDHSEGRGFYLPQFFSADSGQYEHSDEDKRYDRSKKPL